MDMRKISDLKKGPVRHSNMPLDFVDRVRAFKQVLIEVDLATLEETLDNLNSDMHPENELLIMEHIARVYQYYISQKEITALPIKHEVFAVLVLASTGTDDF